MTRLSIQDMQREAAAAVHRSPSRRALLKGLAIGGAGLAVGASFRPSSVLADAGYEAAGEIANIALTAEYLAVTLLGNVIANAGVLGLNGSALSVLNAARAAEQDHVTVLELLGAQGLTTTFSVPGGPSFFTSLPTVVNTIITLETAFIAAYLTAQLEFAKAGAADLAQLAGRIMGVEAEHRVLARSLAGLNPPNNVSFEDTSFAKVRDAAAALGALGFLSPSGSNSFSYPGPGPIDFTGMTQRYP